MIITFYDKEFIAVKDNSSLNVGSWSLTKKAVDYDSFTATCQKFNESINPTFVVMQDDYGQYVYGAFSGVPMINSKEQTEITASDLKTILNNEVVLSLGSYSTVKDLLEYVLNNFKAQCVDEALAVEFNLDNIADIEMDGVFVPDVELGKYNAWDIVSTYITYYDIFMESKLDLVNKKIVFDFYPLQEAQDTINLETLNIRNYGKHIAPTNTARVIEIDSDAGTLTYGREYVLLADNTITNDTSLRDLYPIKVKIFSTDLDAVVELANSRYSESIEINSVSVRDALLGFKYKVYERAGVFYKDLPAGEIMTNSSGQSTIKLGYKSDDILFYIA